jgi:HK97 gp10 family phage protein
MPAAHWVKLNETRAALKALPDHVKGRVQKTADVTAFQIVQMASRAAPRLTGKLQSALVWRSRPSTLSSIVGIDTSAHYWKFQEYGTVNHPARPFLRPAKEAMAEDHESRLIQALEQSMAQMEREAK